MSSSKKSRLERNLAMRPENLDQSAAILDAHPKGLTVAALSDKLCRSEGVTLARLHGLRDAGRAEWITGHKARNYKAGRWALTTHRAVAVADAERCAEQAAISARQRKLKRQRASEAEKRAARAAEVVDSFELPPVRIIVPAAHAKRLRPAGPPSVWALGAMA